MIYVKVFRDNDIIGQYGLKDRGEVDQIASFIHGAMATEQSIKFKEEHPDV